MRRFVILLSLLITSSPTLAADGTDFSGAWKRDCEKDYGLKIARVAKDQFSVAFCGPASCGGPVWIPRTPIAGDAKFKIVSDSEIGVRRVDIPEDFLTYHRCSRDPESWDRTFEAERLPQPEPENNKAR